MSHKKLQKIKKQKQDRPLIHFKYCGRMCVEPYDIYKDVYEVRLADGSYYGTVKVKYETSLMALLDRVLTLFPQLRYMEYKVDYDIVFVMRV